MVDRLPGFEKYFEEDKEIVSYCTSDELVEKARYYFTHTEERNRIAFYGYNRAIAEHSFLHRAEPILYKCGLIN